MLIRDIQHPKEVLFRSYKDIPIYASFWVHEIALERLQSLWIKMEASILILGSGAGAFDQKLLDTGYKNITSVDIISDDYLPNGTHFINMDLNSDFSCLGKFDVVIALEIIEHLENQFHFIRNINQLLSIGWYAIISTPNVISRIAKIWFLLFWTVYSFHKGTLTKIWHIQPILPHIFQLNIFQHWFHLVGEYFNTSANMTKEYRKQMGIFRYLLYGFLLPILLIWGRGEISIYVLQKNKNLWR